MMATRKKKAAGFWVFLCLLGAGVIAFIGYRINNHHALFANLPEDLKATQIIYKKENEFSIGWGPGDNETGFIVYALPNKTVEHIQSEKMAYVSLLNVRDRNTDWYGAWAQTPVPPQPSPIPGDDKAPTKFRAGAFLDRYGFGIDVQPGYLSDVDQAMNNAGSYYAYGRGGSLLIISPQKRKAYFLYAG
jgi:hypothetical protein